MNVSGISAHSCWGRRSKGVPPSSRAPVGAPDHAAPLLSHNIENQQEAMPPFVGDGVLDVPDGRKIIAHLQDDVTHLSIPRSRAAISGLRAGALPRLASETRRWPALWPPDGPCRIRLYLGNHPSPAAPELPSREAKLYWKFLMNLLCQSPRGPGTVKTVPYRLFLGPCHPPRPTSNF